nr:hypothetical protein [Tanacetum cinerariifolium]
MRSVGKGCSGVETPLFEGMLVAGVSEEQGDAEEHVQGLCKYETVRKGFSGVETPLFEGMLAARQFAEEGLADEQVQVDDDVAAAVQENVAED